MQTFREKWVTYAISAGLQLFDFFFGQFRVFHN